METSRSTDTIDLSKALPNLVRLFVTNSRTIFVTGFVCLALGLLYYWLAPKTYESKMIIQSDILSESYALKLAENISTHIKDDDTDYLASKLQLSQEEAEQLNDFKVASALSPMSQQMPEKEKVIVVISVRVSDNAMLPKLQKGIIQYLTSNDYIKLRVEENRKVYENVITALDRELKMMDTLKRRISQGKFSTAKIGDVLVMDISGLYAVAGDLYAKKYSTERQLAMVDSIQIIEELTPYRKPVWPKLSVVLISSFLIACMIAGGIIFYPSIRSQVTTPAT